MARNVRLFSITSSLALLTACGCSGGADGNGTTPPAPTSAPTTMGPPAGEAPVGGHPVSLALTADDAAELQRLEAARAAALTISRGEFDSEYRVPHVADLGYDPASAANMDRIQASRLALRPVELERLRDNGFVILTQQQFPTYLNGYTTIYGEDLPLYVSADSILDALHQSYDNILKALELEFLNQELESFLLDARKNLKSRPADVPVQAREDLDLFFSVALSLLQGRVAAPVAGGNATAVSAFVQKAEAASGFLVEELFGVERRFDFSQFEPRGHYTDSITLQQYFRAMMWLGRIDFRLIETTDLGDQVFHRRQLEAVLGMANVVSDAGRKHFENLDAVVEAFVGESDYMRLPEVYALLADLGVESVGDLGGKSDGEIAQAIVDGGYGAQRISSHIMVNKVGGTLPLNRSFAVFGQRYVVDSHVFSNLVYDRVGNGEVLRLMPDPLDVAFAAIGNDEAAALLSSGLDAYGYQGDLHAMRMLVDEHPSEYWNANLYSQWLGALRALSPTEDLSDPEAAGLPAVVGTEAWGRRILNTQLSSWAQLRHDTILYAKQSYTTGVSCEFPDAYVDPYPEFFERVGALATAGRALADRFSQVPGALSQRIGAYFSELERIMTMLGDMAHAQRIGEAFSAEQMAFINEAVRPEGGVCGGPPTYSGWYARLLFDQFDETEPTIADVHTQPTDEVGNFVGRVLHVGTGGPRLMIVTAETCTGPRAYAGLAATYHEKITENFERLTDPEWAEQVYFAPDVDWVEPILAR